MRNISLEIEKVGDSGEFHFKATLDMVIYKEYVSCYYNTDLNKDLSAKIVAGQISTGDIQVDFTMFYRMLDRNVKYFIKMQSRD